MTRTETFTGRVAGRPSPNRDDPEAPDNEIERLTKWLIREGYGHSTGILRRRWPDAQRPARPDSIVCHA